MSDSLLVGLFFAIVFAPCLLAFLSSSFAESKDERYLEKAPMPEHHGCDPAPIQAMLPELALSEDFEIRSFPKGLAQRRLLLRDTDSGVRLTIAQLREAAAELVKQGCQALVHELALVAAAMAATGRTVTAAAREALEAARNAHAWFAWSAAPEHRAGEAWAESPPPIELDLSLDSGWRESTQAA